MSHFFVSSDNLEGRHFLDFASERRKLALGARFVKVNRRRIRKRSLESFLKEKAFESPTLAFERARHLRDICGLAADSSRPIAEGESRARLDACLSRILRRRNAALRAETSTCRIHFPVERALFDQLSQRLFGDEDGVLYPLKGTSDAFFHKPARGLVEAHCRRIAEEREAQPAKASVDAQLKAELGKLRQMLCAQKAHERFGFSRVQKVFGWLRFADEPGAFYRFEVSRHVSEVDVDSRRPVRVVEREVPLHTKRDFAGHGDLQGEDELASFLDSLPEKASVSAVDLSPPQRAFFKCFIVGSNGEVQNPKKAFDFLAEAQKTEPRGPCTETLQNQASPKPLLPAKPPAQSCALETRLVNPLLLGQFLTRPAQVPSFVARAELGEEAERAVQLRYQDWGLENGDFFDGFLFRSEHGDPYGEHPSKSPANPDKRAVLRDYLSRTNSLVDQVRHSLLRERELLLRCAQSPK